MIPLAVPRPMHPTPLDRRRAQAARTAAARHELGHAIAETVRVRRVLPGRV